MSDQYANVSKSKLKLKNDSEIKKKKNKRKDKEKLKKQIETAAADLESNNVSGSSSQTRPPQGRQLTKAEESFKKMQEKIRNKRIMDRAKMTHKERVEKFNQHLDSLTEHFDIPKVSWTK